MERFRIRDSYADPNTTYVDFSNGYIEIGGSRSERERIAEIIVKALNEAERTRGT